jgi:hypothetical protein
MLEEIRNIFDQGKVGVPTGGVESNQFCENGHNLVEHGFIVERYSFSCWSVTLTASSENSTVT